MRSALFAGHAHLVRGALNCLAAKVTPLDVDLRPRFIMQLADQLVLRTPRSASARYALRAVHWYHLANAVTSNIIEPISSDDGELLTRLSLFRIPIKFVFAFGEAPSPFETVVRSAEAVGHLRLGRLPTSSNVNDYRTVRLPFVQLRGWGLNKLLPPRLLAVPERPWTADDFADLVALFLRERIHFLASYFGHPVPFAFVLPGALGGQVAKSLCVSLRGRRSVYREKFQWLHAKADQPDKIMTLLAVNENLSMRPSLVEMPERATSTQDPNHDRRASPCGGRQTTDLTTSLKT